MSTATETRKKINPVVVGEDTALLVMMATLSVEANIWMFMRGRKGQGHKIFSCRRLSLALEKYSPISYYSKRQLGMKQNLFHLVK